MSVCARRAAVIGLCVLFGSIATGAEQGGQDRDAILCAGMTDDYYARLPNLPKNVIAAILMTAKGKKVGQLAAEWKVKPDDLFRGEPVRISDSPATFFIVMVYPGSVPNEFWLVRQSREHARILLRMNTGCMQVAQTSSHGYRDITAIYYPPAGFKPGRTETYRYDGSRYRLNRRRTLPEVPPSE